MKEPQKPGNPMDYFGVSVLFSTAGLGISFYEMERILAGKGLDWLIIPIIISIIGAGLALREANNSVQP